MAVENPNDREPQEIEGLEFTAETPLIRTSKVDWGTRTAYDVVIRTFDPRALALGTLKADGKVVVKVVPKNGTGKANAKREFK